MESLDPRVMASPFMLLFAPFLVFTYGSAVESAASSFVLMECETDNQCPSGYYCYEESHYCDMCIDCSEYLRQPSWRVCPKIPHDCGACVTGYEEEILYKGTREFCIPSNNYSLEQTVVPGHFYERYFWATGMLFLMLPITYYVFCRSRGRVNVHNYHGAPREDPPPYRSMELTNLANNQSSPSASSQQHAHLPPSTSVNKEVLAEENHEIRVRQQKESPVQAVPFRQPCYEPEYLNLSEVGQDDVDSFSEEIVIPALELDDENTMPSSWVPSETGDNNSGEEILQCELAGPEVESDSEDALEPAHKRHKPDDASNGPLNINLVINNNVIINNVQP